METRTQKHVTNELEELAEVEEPIELDEEIGTIRPPDPITLPTVQTQGSPTADKPLEQLAQLGRDLAQVKPIEPPPKPAPAPTIHQRPTSGFD